MATELNLYDAQDAGIAQPVIYPLGVDQGDGGIDPGKGINYTYGIAGIGFLSAASDQNPYQRGLKNVLKDQVNNSEQPGDQSFTDWWYRSQTDWTSGAGTKFMEPANDEKVQSSFYSSVGIDSWTNGEVRLLPAIEEVASFTTASVSPVVDSLVTNYGTSSNPLADRTYVASGKDVKFYYSDFAVGVPVLSATNLETAEYVINLAVGRGYVYACTNKGVWMLEADPNLSVGGGIGLPGTPAKVFSFPYTNAKSRVFYEKDRLIMVQRGYIWDEAPPDPLGGETALTTSGALYNATSLVKWIGSAEHPTGIFMAASSSAGSVIYSITLDTTGVLPVLAAPISVAEFPVGEEILHIASYLGAYLLIGTTLGVRIGTIQNGAIGYGPIMDSPIPTGPFTTHSRFAYYPTADAGEGRGGVVRMDLSNVDSTGRAAWACDRRVPAGADPVMSVCASVSGKIRLITLTSVGYDDTWKVFTDSDTYEASGFISTGFIRFGTTEKKYFDGVSVLMNSEWDGGLTVTGLDEDGVVSLVGSATPASGTSIDFSIDPAAPSSTIQLGFTLTATDDASGSPVLAFWQLRALPSVTRQRLIRVQLLNFDFERDSLGVRNGYEGFAIARWRSLEERSRDGWPFTYQDFSTGETYRVVLEQVSFSQDSPPSSNASGFGGMIDLTLRVIG